MYEYRAAFLRAVDGDTIDLRLDLGLNVHKVERLRLFGIDTPELNSSDAALREQAKNARLYTDTALMSAQHIVVRTEKPYPTDKYGRYLAKVAFKCAGDLDWRDLSGELIAANLAVRYDGGARG